MNYNLLEDISTITTLPLKTLSKLSDKSIECICNSVYESKLVDEPVSVIDIGIGKLNIIVKQDSISYNFIPSKDLDTKVKTTIIKNVNPLVKTIEEGLASRILNTYKDLI